jgi:hypothetical protein
MRRRLVLFTVVSALIAPGGAHAAPLPPRGALGPEQGVTATASPKALTIAFTGASAAWGRAHAGREVELTCVDRPAQGLLLAEDASVADADDGPPHATRVAADGASVRFAVTGPPGDLCAVNARSTWDVPPSAELAWAAVTPDGAAYVEEWQRGLRMADVLYAAQPHDAYAPAAAVVADGGGEVVALDDPNGTPPAGKIGYWSKGRAVSVVATTASGRRLAIQDLGRGMLRTDVLEPLLEWGPAAGVRQTDPRASLGVPGLDGADVSARLHGDRVALRFTGEAAATYREHAGDVVRVICVQVPPPALLGEVQVVDRHPAVTTVRVPRHGGVIRAAAPAAHHDLCVAEDAEGADIALAVVTPAAERYVMDVLAPMALALSGEAPGALVPAGTARYPGAATIVAAHQDYVALPTPGAPVPPGKLGVWTDADQQALLAFGDGGGRRRYVYADEGHGTMRTNIFTGILGVLAQTTTSAR